MNYSAKDYKMFIAGEWVASESLKTFDVFSPVTAERLGSAPLGTRADVQRAIQAANAAWRDWAKRGPFERAAVLKKAAVLVAERREELSYILTLEQGKPFHSEAQDEVSEIID